MSEVLEVALRQTVGKLNNLRLRRSGHLPAVLYGHGKESVNLSIPADQLETTLRHGAHVVELRGGADGQALLQEVQWDIFQQHVLHLDLLRVDASDRVKVEIPIVLRGEAPGASEGGVIEQLFRTIEIETSPSNIPENLHLSINDLHLGGSLKLADIENLPAGAKIVSDTQATAVQCVEPTVVSDGDEEAAVDGSEPEVIGRKEGDKEGTDE